MVDLDASGVDQGATPLVRRCIRVHGWDAPKARRVLAAYRQFLTLKTEHEDWDATVLSPCPLVDQMWQQHVLDVVNYCHDTMLLCGRVAGHDPDGAASGKAERDEATRRALEVRFPDYDRAVWGHEVPVERDEKMTIGLRDMSGEVTVFELKRRTRLGNLFAAFADRKGISITGLAFMLDGEPVGSDERPIDLGLEDGDVIVALPRQSGC